MEVLEMRADIVRPAIGPAFEPALDHEASSLTSSNGLSRADRATRLSIRTNPGGRSSNTVLLSEVSVERLDWLWPGRIAMGKLTIVVGDPDLGKSFLSLDLAARVTRGLAWPDDSTRAAPLGDVLLFNAEDGLADTVCPRLVAAGADMSRVSAITSVNEERGGERCFSLAEDLDLLERHLNERAATGDYRSDRGLSWRRGRRE